MDPHAQSLPAASDPMIGDAPSRWSKWLHPELPKDILPDVRRRYIITGQFTFFIFLSRLFFSSSDLLTIADPLLLYMDAVAVTFFGGLHLWYVRKGDQRTTALLLVVSLTGWLFFKASYYGEQGLMFLFLYTLIIITFFLIDFHEKRLLLGLVALPVTALITLEITGYAWFNNPALLAETIYQTRLLSIASNLFLFYIILSAYLSSTLSTEANLLAKQQRLAEMAGRLQELNTLKEEYNQTLQQRLEEALAEVRQKDRALVQADMDAEERERHRIAQELHDGVGALLGTLKHRLGNMRALVREERQVEYNEAMTLIDRACEEVRTASHKMQPLLFEELGLVNVLSDLLERVNGSGPLRMVLVATAYPEGVAMQIERAVYRIAQELMNNVLRHANATRFSVQLAVREGQVVLTAEDDGQGFDPRVAGSGLGMKGIAHRVEALGGTWSVESAPGRGVVTIVEIPLNEATPA